VAVDGGRPRRSGSVDVVVTVLDVNDNSPTFSSTSLQVRVREDSAVGTVVCRATATDADHGLNAQLRYDFTAETRRQHGQTFDVRPHTGAIVVVGALDYETRREYTLYVTASDHAEALALTGMITVVVHVDDVNDHAPDIGFNFRLPTATTSRQIDLQHDDQPSPVVVVDRAAPVGSFVAHVTVRDADDGENGRFRCVLLSTSGSRHEANGTGNTFALRQMYDTEFVIVTAARLGERSATLTTHDDSLTLVVYCADGGRPARTSEARLIVTVSDSDLHASTDHRLLNDVAPGKRIALAVADDVPIGTTIYCPRLSGGADRNSVTKTVYRITDVLFGSSALRYLEVDARSGVVRTKLTLNRERRCRLEVDLWRDQDGTSSRQWLSVRLSIIVVSASQHRRHSHHDDDDDGDDDSAVLEENADVHYEFSVAENSDGGTQVGSLTATDLCLPTSNHDDDQQVRYALVGEHSSSLSKLFQVGADDGHLTTLAPLDRELRREYTLLVLGRSLTAVNHVDASGCQSSAAARRAAVQTLLRVHVTVTDVNDNSPLFQFPRPGNDVITVSRAEAAPGHVVGRLRARDKDVGQNARISYDMESYQQHWSAAFSIDHATGRLAHLPLSSLSSCLQTVYKIIKINKQNIEVEYAANLWYFRYQIPLALQQLKLIIVVMLHGLLSSNRSN